MKKLIILTLLILTIWMINIKLYEVDKSVNELRQELNPYALELKEKK